MSDLTELQKRLLAAIDISEYGDAITDPIWMFSIQDNIEDVRSAAIPAIVGSLITKGYVGTSCSGTDEHCIWMTESGAAAYRAANEGKSHSHLPTEYDQFRAETLSGDTDLEFSKWHDQLLERIYKATAIPEELLQETK